VPDAATTFTPRSRGPLRVDPCRLAADKIMRLSAQTPVIENGFVHLPDEAHRLAGAVSELTAFPPVRHDDQVDSTA
jgi:predicted phage terminase large subunit-like protein